MARTRIRPKGRSIRTSVKSGNFRSTRSGAGMTSKGVKAYRRANPGSKLKIQVGLLKNPKIICAFCSYKNNINGIQKYAEVTAMYKKELFRKIGYFDSVRFAADSEFKERIRKIYCRSRIKISSEVLYHVFRRNNSLTKSKISNIKSETRKNYKKNYLNWHSTANKLYIPYPLIKRPFVVDKLML